MAFPVTLNGRTYTLADFSGTNYVDGFPDALEDFVTQAGNIYTTTSTSSVVIGTGSKTFTVADSAKPYTVGTPLRIADAAAPATNWIDGIVTSYSGTTLVVNAVAYAGSGTISSWNINIGGAAIAYTGTLPIAQGGTGGTTEAAARTNLDVYSKSEADSLFLDVATYGTKLDGIEAGADVTDTTNVTAAGALMDSELTNITAVKALDQGVATTDSPAFAGLSVNSNPLPTAGSLSNRNKIINGNFGINQRAVSGTVTLSAGAYGHDRWKAGASGCTYTFATSANVTTITISAGSLVQIIEGLNLQSGTHVLSWTGTVQMKIAGGSAGNSGMTGTLTGGTNAAVETSGTGTLSLVQLEAGDTATPFELRSVGQELALCQRYFTKLGGEIAGDIYLGGYITSAGAVFQTLTLPVKMRAAPTGTVVGTWGVVNVAQPTVPYISTNTFAFYAAGTVVGQGLVYTTGTTTYLTYSAEL